MCNVLNNSGVSHSNSPLTRHHLIAASLVAASLFASCKKESSTKTLLPLSFKQAAGIWVPYEIRIHDGTIQTNSLVGFTVFDFYAESVQINKDGTYEAIFWLDPDNRVIINPGRKEFKYYPLRSEIIFEAAPFPVFKIEKYGNEEMWLSHDGNLYKLKREIRFP